MGVKTKKNYQLQPPSPNLPSKCIFHSHLLKYWEEDLLKREKRKRVERIRAKLKILEIYRSLHLNLVRASWRWEEWQAFESIQTRFICSRIHSAGLLKLTSFIMISLSAVFARLAQCPIRTVCLSTSLLERKAPIVSKWGLRVLLVLKNFYLTSKFQCLPVLLKNMKTPEEFYLIVRKVGNLSLCL